MGSARAGSPPLLRPLQTCFVVDDVASAAESCAERFGWGPFHRFSADVPDARYGDWRGFRIAFVDVPTGPAMFELLEQQGSRESGADPASTPRERQRAKEPEGAAGAGSPSGVLALDRATIATPDLDRALRFYSAAFGWSDPVPETRTLRWGAGREARLRRFLGRAGALEIELLEPSPGGDDPYARHLARGDHGLVHAGGPAHAVRPTDPDPALRAAWCETGEAFTLHDWAGGAGTLQLRTADPGDAEIC